jgi:Na+/phosphate symporter
MGNKRFLKKETIERYVSKMGKKAFEKEMKRRLKVIEKNYNYKREKILDILEKLKNM